MIWIFVAAVLILDTLLLLPFIGEWRRRRMDDDARQDAPGAFSRLSRGLTHYRWFGPEDGPVVVCVHGLTTPSFVWEGLAPKLADRGFRVLVYDLFGRGYSDRPKARQDAAFFVRQLDELVQDQGVSDPFVLIGYSMGGAIATAYATVFPTKLRQVVLIAPGGVKHEVDPKVRLARDVPLFGEWLMLRRFPDMHRRGCEAERDLPSSVPDIVDRQIGELAFRGYIPAILESMRGILRKPQMREHRHVAENGVPVLAIWGEADEVIPLSARDLLAEWNGDAEQVVIAGAGHGLPYTHTGQVARALGPRLSP